jgi:hypothetical protein
MHCDLFCKGNLELGREKEYLSIAPDMFSSSFCTSKYRSISQCATLPLPPSSHPIPKTYQCWYNDANFVPLLHS